MIRELFLKYKVPGANLYLRQLFDRKIISLENKSNSSTFIRSLYVKIICKSLQCFNKLLFYIVFNLPMRCKSPKLSK